MQAPAWSVSEGSGLFGEFLDDKRPATSLPLWFKSMASTIARGWIAGLYRNNRWFLESCLPQNPPSSHRGNDVAGGKRLQFGDLAPDFSLPATSGETVSLSDFRGRAPVVLFFYAKNNTAVCSTEACSFRDRHAVFHDAAAEVIGVSSDSPDSHRRFAERLRLPFVLLSDTDGAVRARYGVRKTFGFIPGRTTFLIDKHGVIRHVFSSQFQPDKHVSEALGALQKLRGEE
jgi:peroxiredoxin Q/BCP